jgi:small-conductance mechanosensitive channel
MNEQKKSKVSIFNKKQQISLLVLTIILLSLLIYLILSGTNFLVSILVISFLFLFFFGLIYKSNEISLSSYLPSSREKPESSRKKSKKQYKVETLIRDTPESLDFTYHRPLIRKCPNCGLILTRSAKKCPNCGNNPTQ